MPWILSGSFFFYSNQSMPHHLMDDQDDISMSGHSVGVVENPLFADNDDLDFTPTYAGLKEKEAEVS